MSNFPKREAEIMALSSQMIAGFNTNPGRFPGADPNSIVLARDTVQALKETQQAARANAQIATEEKDKGMRELVALMRTQLKQAALDVQDDEEHMELIGWKSKSSTKPKRVPGPPSNLIALWQGNGQVALDWDAPKPEAGGQVRTYLIERRTKPTVETSFSEWSQVGISFDRSMLLSNQPRGMITEFQVVAVNNTGRSLPSNVAEI